MNIFCSQQALPCLLLYYELVRLPKQHTVSSPLFSFSTASLKYFGSPKFRCKHFRLPATDLDPAMPICTHHLTHISVPTSSKWKPWSFWNKEYFGAQYLHAFALWLTDCHPLGFAQLVTLLHARFCSRLLVRLYLCWIHQLVRTSFAWRSHDFPLCYL